MSIIRVDDHFAVVLLGVVVAWHLSFKAAMDYLDELKAMN